MTVNPKEDLFLYVLGHIQRLRDAGLIKTNLKLSANGKKRFAKLIESGYYLDQNTVKGVMEVLKADPEISITYNAQGFDIK